MTDSTETILTYPEHHAAWLEAIGVTSWQARQPMQQGISPTKTEKNTQKSDPAPHAQTTQATPPAATRMALTPQIETAEYWVIAQQAPSPAQAYLLAGMMQAIGAKSVVYSHPAADSHSSVVATELASWPKLVVQSLPFVGVLELPETLKVLILGENALPISPAQSWQLPSLATLLAEPATKREAWETLKKAKIG